MPHPRAPRAPAPRELLDIPGLQQARLLHRNDRNEVAAGYWTVPGPWHGRPVIAKRLHTDTPLWVAKSQAEIRIYRLFTRHRPPVRVPRLVHTDGRRLLILEQLPGCPLAGGRWPDRPVPAATVDATLHTLTTLADWQPPTDALRPVIDYPARIDRYHHRHRLLTGRDARALTALLDRSGPPRQFAHGDPLPANLIDDSGRLALIDWEFAGLYLPGYDLALLGVVLTDTPYATAAIDQVVADTGIGGPYLLNRALILTRELRMHLELPAGHRLRDRLPRIRRAWAQTRHQLHASPGSR